MPRSLGRAGLLLAEQVPEPHQRPAAGFHLPGDDPLIRVDVVQPPEGFVGVVDERRRSRRPPRWRCRRTGALCPRRWPPNRIGPRPHPRRRSPPACRLPARSQPGPPPGDLADHVRAREGRRQLLQRDAQPLAAPAATSPFAAGRTGSRPRRRASRSRLCPVRRKRMYSLQSRRCAVRCQRCGPFLLQPQDLGDDVLGGRECCRCARKRNAGYRRTAPGRPGHAAQVQPAEHAGDGRHSLIHRQQVEHLGRDAHAQDLLRIDAGFLRSPCGWCAATAAQSSSGSCSAHSGCG